MQIFIIIILSVIFGFINLQIIISDQKIKKIPNKNLLQLLILLPFWYIYLYLFPLGEINILNFIMQIFISFIISFGLFNFGIWRAGDAKYLLILNLFIPYIGIITFIGNLGLLTISYLFCYFLWFFIGKSIIYKGYAKDLIKNIKIDLKSKWNFYKNNKGNRALLVILVWIINFLIIFVSIRLARIYILGYLLKFPEKFNYIYIIEKYHFYIVFFIIFLGILLLYILKKIHIFIIKKIILKNIYLAKYIKGLSIYILLFFLIIFISHEYTISPQQTVYYMKKILTIYILLWVIIKIGIYGYNLSFEVAESYFIKIENLSPGKIVDKKYLHKLFGNQRCLGFLSNTKGVMQNYKKEKYFLNITPESFFLKIRNPIDKKTVSELKNIYSVVNLYHSKKNKKFRPNYNIKILYSFSFALYIFIGFLTTLIFSNDIITFILKKIIEFINF